MLSNAYGTRKKKTAEKKNEKYAVLDRLDEVAAAHGIKYAEE